MVGKFDKYEEADEALDKMRKIRHKYGNLLHCEHEFECAHTDEENDALKQLYFKRARRNIYQIASIIKYRASIYGIYGLNDKHEKSVLRIKNMKNRI